MRSNTNHLSLGWFGAKPSQWAGAINPLPADMSLGTYTLTLQNLVVGSVIYIDSQDGVHSFELRTADASEEVFELGVYGANAMNQLRIKVRKGSSAPYYQPYETLTTAVVGAQSIYVSQIPD